MAHQFKRHRLSKSSIFILSIAAFLVVGIASFILAYGLTDGWLSVAQWFGSKYAILLYMGIGIFAVVTAIVLLRERYKKL